jgi:formate/nitrite transporter
LAVTVAEHKLAIPFTQAFIRGILCNILVILAIMMALSAKDIISKIFCIIFPIACFVACGFEHCVANMYLIPLGLLAKGSHLYETFTMFRNIIPVTLGNIVGGIFIIAIHPHRIQQISNRLRQTSQEKNK